MANLPEWAKPHVTMEGWESRGSYACPPLENGVLVSVNSWGGVSVWDVDFLIPIAELGPNRLPEAIHHAETIARAIQAAQAAAEVQGG